MVNRKDKNEGLIVIAVSDLTYLRVEVNGIRFVGLLICITENHRLSGNRKYKTADLVYEAKCFVEYTIFA